MTVPPNPNYPYGEPTPPPSANYAYAGPPPHGYTAPLTPNYQPNQKELSDAALAHYLGIIGWIGPLVMLLTSGQKSPYVRSHAAKALNFQLSLMIYSFAGMILMCVLSTIFIAAAVASEAEWIAVIVWILYLLAAVGLLAWDIVASCTAGSRAKRGETHRYAASITMIKG